MTMSVTRVVFAKRKIMPDSIPVISKPVPNDTCLYIGDISLLYVFLLDLLFFIDYSQFKILKFMFYISPILPYNISAYLILLLSYIIDFLKVVTLITCM